MFTTIDFGPSDDWACICGDCGNNFKWADITDFTCPSCGKFPLPCVDWLDSSVTERYCTHINDFTNKFTAEED